MKPENCKKPYEAPEAVVVCFDKEDVITASDTRMPAISGSQMPGLY